jgi:thiamine transport system ATP-binding protein
MTAARLDVDNLTVRFGDRVVLDHFSMHAEPGEIVGLFGTSGRGKSTVLRAIAGLLLPEAGRVLIDGSDQVAVPTHRRNIGYVFQDLQLFEHLTVAENVGYGLTIAKVARPERDRRVAELLDMVALNDRGRERITNLSGGERQRIALARSLATRPRALLLDEPFSALDRDLHDRLVTETRALLKRLSVTSVHVTHDRSEAAELCDRTLSLDD